MRHTRLHNQSHCGTVVVNRESRGQPCTEDKELRCNTDVSLHVQSKKQMRVSSGETSHTKPDGTLSPNAHPPHRKPLGPSFSLRKETVPVPNSPTPLWVIQKSGSLLGEQQEKADSSHWRPIISISAQNNQSVFAGSEPTATVSSFLLRKEKIQPHIHCYKCSRNYTKN